MHYKMILTVLLVGGLGQNIVSMEMELNDNEKSQNAEELSLSEKSTQKIIDRWKNDAKGFIAVHCAAIKQYLTGYRIKVVECSSKKKILYESSYGTVLAKKFHTLNVRCDQEGCEMYIEMMFKPNQESKFDEIQDTIEKAYIELKAKKNKEYPYAYELNGYIPV